MSRLRSAPAVAAAVIGAAACSPTDDRVGTLDLSLTGRSTTGAIYRLRDAELTIAPLGLVVRSEDDPDRQVITARLPAGLYTVGVAAGWRLERVSSGTAEPVFAVLTSDNPQPFDVIPGEATPVVLQFRADGQDVQLGDGDVDISIGIDDQPRGATDAGVADGPGPDAPAAPDAGPIDAPAAPDAGPVDAAPGFVRIVSAPIGATTDNTPTIAFETSRPDQTLCVSAAATEPCTSPYTAPPLADGVRTIAVQLVDGSARDEVAFVIDTTPATIQLAAHITDTLMQRRLEFSANEAASFACSLDGASFQSCVSPVVTPQLPPFTPHVFRVRATDQVGLVGEASISFSVP